MRLWHSGLVLAAVLILSAVVCGSTFPLIVSVDDGAFTKIQDAIDATEPGGVIVIRSGTYEENLLIDRPLTLIGADGAVVEPEDSARPAIAVDETGAVSIQGLTIRGAVVGIDLMNSSCSILDCTIRASSTGVNSVAFEGTTVLMDHVEFRGSGTGTGLALLGMGLSLLANCEFDRFGTGASLGGTTSVAICGCSFERCFDGLTILNTASVTLIGNTIRGNYGSGISLSQHLADLPDETLILLGNVIEENGYWGISLCGYDAMEPDVLFGVIEGTGNAFRDNRRGRTCPEDLALPAGFFLEE